MAKLYETVGDVRTDVDALFASRNLRTDGGSFYPYIQSLVFGIVDATNILLFNECFSPAA